MRGIVVAGVVSTTVLASCGLGVVDVQEGPAPAELSVASSVVADPDDPSRVRVAVRATLDPGVGADGAPRELTSDILGVEGTDHSPTAGDPGSDPSWLSIESYDAPGPEGVRLRLPVPGALGLSHSITMRVRVDATPGPTIPLADGEDLVIRAEPPSNPAETLEWSLELTSASEPSFLVQMHGDESWPAELRVTRDRIPPETLPVEATLRVRWDRALTLFELTPEERYDLSLRSEIVMVWTVEATDG